MTGKQKPVVHCDTCDDLRPHIVIDHKPEADDEGRQFTRRQCSNCGSHTRRYADDEPDRNRPVDPQ